MGTIATFYHPLFLKHYEFMHPERPERLNAIRETLLESDIAAELDWLEFEPASQEQITAVHSPDHHGRVHRISQQGGGHFDVDTYSNEHSYEAAMLAAGATVAASEAVLTGTHPLAVALVRPPGHHATPEHPMGFCLFNNVAVAARHAIQEHGLKRVMVIDWDVHHGNGTQDIFLTDPAVLYFSTHQYPWYPGSGHWQETGVGPGEGTTLNVPLPAATGDHGFARVWSEVLAPALRRFEPQLILLSAGFDAHWRDPLGDLQLTLDGYAHLAATLRDLARDTNAKLAVVLEGGYDLTALSQGMLTTLRALSNHPPAPHQEPTPSRPEPDLTSLLRQIRQMHKLA
jgi:acetoin utilization deacetylase AcuC-like enzyme